ncbi:Uncharacterised protein [Mycobacteroides abscessus subsp. abscessus]|nr:Uncharacterised protein [Mycobacteroides abscessus subsp. abscessus]
MLTHRFDGELTAATTTGQPSGQYRTDCETLVGVVGTDLYRQLAGDAVRLGDTPDH